MIVPTGLMKRRQIEAAVKSVVEELSPAVLRIRYEIGEDWTGKLAVFFRVLLSDEASKPKNLRQIAPKVVSLTSERLDIPELGLFPFFDFRSEGEQALIREPAWDVVDGLPG